MISWIDATEIAPANWQQWYIAYVFVDAFPEGEQSFIKILR